MSNHSILQYCIQQKITLLSSWANTMGNPLGNMSPSLCVQPCTSHFSNIFYEKVNISANTVVPRNSGHQNSGLPLSSGQFLGDQLFGLFLCSNSPVLVDSLSSGHFLGKRLSDFSNNYGVFLLLFSHSAFSTVSFK